MTTQAPPSTVPPKRKLPFKRTAVRSSVDTPENKPDKKETDDIDLFRRGGRRFFEDQEKQSAEKAARKEKERERRAKAVEGEEALKSEAAKQLFKESGENEIPSSPVKQGRRPERRESKRRCVSLSDDDDEPPYTPSATRKLPHAASQSPSKSSKGTPMSGQKRGTSNSVRPQARGRSIDEDVVSLSDSDEGKNSLTKPVTDDGKLKMRNATAEADQELFTQDDGSDIVEIDEPEVEDELTRKYFEEAKARVEANKAEEEARKAKAGDAGSPEPTVDVLIIPHAAELRPLKVRLLFSQKMGPAKKRWMNAQFKKNSALTEESFRDVFFTWKGNKLYDHTTLASLGIKPDAQGRLYPAWEHSREGYEDRSNVLLEAWTPDLFEQYQREREREQKRAIGELDPEEELDGEPDPEPAKQKPPGIKILLKSKDREEMKLTIHPDVRIALLIKAFRVQRQIPIETEVQILWDGEVLDPDTTVGDAGMEDMDSVDVHIK
jgi:hypothetical protein